MKWLDMELNRFVWYMNYDIELKGKSVVKSWLRRLRLYIEWNFESMMEWLSYCKKLELVNLILWGN